MDFGGIIDGISSGFSGAFGQNAGQTGFGDSFMGTLLPPLVLGGLSYLSNQQQADSQADRYQAGYENSIELAKINNAAALERLELQLAKAEAAGDKAAAVKLKIARAQLISKGYDNMMQGVMQARQGQSNALQYMGTLLSGIAKEDMRSPVGR